MGRGSTDLDSQEYDDYLSKNGKTKELRERNKERKTSHDRDGKGWHFGLDDKPVKCRDRREYEQALQTRGLMRKSEAGNLK